MVIRVVLLTLDTILSLAKSRLTLLVNNLYSLETIELVVEVLKKRSDSINSLVKIIKPKNRR